MAGLELSGKRRNRPRHTFFIFCQFTFQGDFSDNKNYSLKIPFLNKNTSNRMKPNVGSEQSL